MKKVYISSDLPISSKNILREIYRSNSTVKILHANDICLQKSSPIEVALYLTRVSADVIVTKNLCDCLKTIGLKYPIIIHVDNNLTLSKMKDNFLHLYVESFPKLDTGVPEIMVKQNSITFTF